MLSNDSVQKVSDKLLFLSFSISSALETIKFDLHALDDYEEDENELWFLSCVSSFLSRKH